ncbi:MAG: hypothetical protein KDK61_08985, partial [Simkania sp.]|nr:hypothetical protein [Simkania sp.]
PIESPNQTTAVFLAPEEINNDLIQKGSYPSHVDPSLAEVFSIGLTILSSGTLEDCDDVYKTSPYELRKDRLSSLLRIFKEKYSDYLFQTVASMLALNPQERRRCSSIASSLYEYEQYILDLEPFQPPRQGFTQPQPQPQSQYHNTGGYPAHQSYQMQSQPVPQQPMYLQGQNQPMRGTYQQPPTNFGQPGYGYRPQGMVQHQRPM